MTTSSYFPQQTLTDCLHKWGTLCLLNLESLTRMHDTDYVN